MAEVVLDRVRKVYPQGGHVAIEEASFSIADGERLVLVGPSGCGKSTLLRMIAGLEPITSGELRIGGRVVNELPPKERDIAMVFQSYALYPNMNVAQNISFGLEMRNVPKPERDAAIERGGELQRDEGPPEALTHQPARHGARGPIAAFACSHGDSGGAQPASADCPQYAMK